MNGFDTLLNLADGDNLPAPTLSADEAEATTRRLTQVADALAMLADSYREGTLRPVEAMDRESREEAIDIAREILEKLRMRFGDMDVEEAITLSPEAQLDQADDIEELSATVNGIVLQAASDDSDALSQSLLEELSVSLGAVAALLKLQALRIAKQCRINEQLETLRRSLERMPANWKEKLEKSSHERLGGLFRKMGDVLWVAAGILLGTNAVGGPPAAEMKSASLVPDSNAAQQASQQQQAQQQATLNQQIKSLRHSAQKQEKQQRNQHKTNSLKDLFSLRPGKAQAAPPKEKEKEKSAKYATDDKTIPGSGAPVNAKQDDAQPSLPAAATPPAPQANAQAQVSQDLQRLAAQLKQQSAINAGIVFGGNVTGGVPLKPSIPKPDMKQQKPSKDPQDPTKPQPPAPPRNSLGR